MKIKWNEVTWYSKLLAVVLAVLIHFLGFYIGRQFQQIHDQPIVVQNTKNENKQTPNFTPGATTGFIREGDNWVLFDYEGNKLGLTVPVQMEPFYDEPSPNHTKLLANPNFKYEISPDQKKVAYIAKPNPAELDQPVLYLANVDGTGKEILASPEWNYAHGAIGQFFWSVDSKSVIYLDSKGDEGSSGYDLYKINIETKAKKKLDSGSISFQ